MSVVFSVLDRKNTFTVPSAVQLKLVGKEAASKNIKDKD